MSIASIRFATHTRRATHPPIAQRVCRLRALDDDQALALAA
jgi:hypothetical protein